jgi:iron complex transport system ATP-binding protein
VEEGNVVNSGLEARDLTLCYDDRVVCHELSLQIPDDRFTAIIGPNGCGKSTLLKALARTLRPSSGQVLLDDRPIGARGSREVARRVALLPQNPVVPDAIRVRDLVARGRYPYHSLWRQWSPGDRAAIDEAVELTGVGDLLERPVAELSGGQRQRVWVAMVLAQQTRTLLLDEPTTFLDIAHQFDLLELFARLQRDGRTVVAVLHDLGQAARFADHLVRMKDGAVVAEGEPEEVLTPDLLADVFGLRSVVVPDPLTRTPMVVPVPSSVPVGTA